MLLLTSSLRAQQIKLSFNAVLMDPIASEGVVYFGTSDGRLYAVNATDGSSVSGFPLDVRAAIGDNSYPITRPSVYYGALGKAIYLTTSKGGVVKIWPNGSIAWTNSFAGSSSYGGTATPAVTPDGTVIVERKTSANIFIVKLKESDGTTVMTSPPLSSTYYDWAGSPAVVGDNIYTSVTRPPNNLSIIVLNRSDLTVKAATMPAPQGWSPAYVRGDGIYYGTASLNSSVVKLNSSTLAPDPRFGPSTHPGRIVLGPSDLGAYTEISASPTSADQDPGGTIYASVQSSNIAEVVAIDAESGSVRGLYYGSYGAGGMVVSSRNIAAYGDGNTMNLFSVTGGGMRSYTVVGRPQRPTYDASTDRFFARTIQGTDGISYLMGFDSP
jgi:hypothetical protein